MLDVDEFFAAYHPGAKRGYRDPQGQVLACVLVAGAFELLTGGQCYHVRGLPIVEGGWAGTMALLPVQDGKELTWGGHTVCIKDGMAYDLLLPAPCPVAEYLEKAFTNAPQLRMKPAEFSLATPYYLEQGLPDLNL